MNGEWQINRVSTPERIFEKVQKEMAQPVGIILFGVDCEFKNEVLQESIAQMPDVRVSLGNSVDADAAKQSFSKEQSVLVVLDGDTSSYPRQRYSAVTALKDSGAKSVVGIFAEVKTISPEDYATVAEFELRLKQFQRLRKQQPEVNEFDYLIIRRE